MAGITLTQAQAKLDLWMAADDAIATGQEYSIGARRLTRADAAAVDAKIEKWDRMVKRLSRGGIQITGATPT